MYSTILLAVDLNDENSWHKALPTAVKLSQVFDAALHVITVLPDFGMNLVAQQFPADFEEKATAEVWRRLDELLEAEIPATAKADPIVAIGTIYEEILDAAKRIDADLIVMSAHRPELRDYLLGPNAARVVRHFDGSVMVVRP
jgi:nucleotide-binding universal stress UspA family protein